MKLGRLNGHLSLSDLPDAPLEIKKIYDDLQQHPTLFSPNKHWSVEERPEQDTSAVGLATAWIGSGGMKNASEQSVREYLDYAGKFDTIGIVDFYKKILHLSGNIFTRAELGTVLDLAVCTKFLNLKQEKLAILEIGPGYGRLAEAFLRCFAPGEITYVLVDAVPSSVQHSWAYLNKCFPHRKIGNHYNGDRLSGDFDAFIIPAWHFAADATDFSVDMAINISSFQEMASETVTAYGALIDQRLRTGGYIYLSNSREYIMRRQFHYPPNWKLELKEKSPRGWTHDHPLEILQKTDVEQSAANQIAEVNYQQDLADRVLTDNLKLREKNATLQKSNSEILKKNVELRKSVSQYQVEIKNLRRSPKGKKLAELDS